MKHFASPRFWACYNSLPKNVRELADKNFELLKSDPKHPSLHFKQIGALWSVRVGDIFEHLALTKRKGLFGFGLDPMLTMTD